MTTYKRYRCPLRRTDGLYLVSDLYAAAFLVARGNKAVALDETSQPGRLAFVIAPASSFRDDYKAFAANEPIAIRDLIDAVYGLKSMLREEIGTSCCEKRNPSD